MREAIDAIESNINAGAGSSCSFRPGAVESIESNSNAGAGSSCNSFRPGADFRMSNTSRNANTSGAAEEPDMPAEVQIEDHDEAFRELQRLQQENGFHYFVCAVRRAQI